MNSRPAELLEGRYGQLGNGARSSMPLKDESDSEVFSVEAEKQDNLSYTTKTITVRGWTISATM